MAAALTHTSNPTPAPPCLSCTMPDERHKLTCATLQLPPYFSGLTLDEKYGPNVHNKGGRPADPR